MTYCDHSHRLDNSPACITMWVTLGRLNCSKSKSINYFSSKYTYQRWNLPVGERLLCLRRGGFAGEGRLPLNPINQGLAAAAQRAAGAWRQHGGVDFHLLVEGAEFYGGNGSIVGVEAQREGHVAKDVLRSEIDAFPRVCYQLYVGYSWVICEKEIQIYELQTYVSCYFWHSELHCQSRIGF